jgi:hypothetical protein
MSPMRRFALSLTILDLELPCFGVFAIFASDQRLVKRCGQELTEGKQRLQKNENHVQLQQQKRH